LLLTLYYREIFTILEGETKCPAIKANIWIVKIFLQVEIR
jgi:hypothetical protein